MKIFLFLAVFSSVIYVTAAFVRWDIFLPDFADLATWRYVFMMSVILTFNIGGEK
tara:strand:- start:1311 stop:1475 length:165 start_codon:yes stop_codon:yes gene_type:complete